ncbi:DUF3592 domain-containing protein [Cellulosimicrobium cellulans]|uniref:DUF3592 domain-containing protein n=1 Tax=Cellulosimicrobium cellulans TaxID=1710 RepID=UPI001962CA10|nr:DUF3592 domain-containing protein [Cellulosimicrobium cellulans]MBN0039097.1 DUF3592 domain-containing protein [Cellulosimicrobium cellulans]
MSAFGVLLVVGASVAALGLIFWLVGFAVGRGRRRGWVRTTGTWTRFETRLVRSSRVTFRTPDGQEHHVYPAMNATSVRPNGTVPVAYDPGHPSRAVIDTFYHRGDVLKTIGAALVGLAVLTVVVAVVVLRPAP